MKQDKAPTRAAVTSAARSNGLRRPDDVPLQPEDLLIIEALARDIVQAERRAERERSGGDLKGAQFACEASTRNGGATSITVFKMR